MAHEERLKAALADRYQIEREIGSGGMATVFLAHDFKHHRRVAIKVLRPELAATLGPDRFVREIEIVAKLSHPHILPLFDSGNADGLLYYVMPFVGGESLRERLDRDGRLSVAETVRLVDEIASALSYAHEQGVVHRDVKPENIMLSGGRAVVADFGIGRAVTAAGGDRLTGTGFAVGTPAYMSPEQAYGEASIDGRSDVYALGCVAYEMVSGRAPFEADRPQGVLAKHAAETVPSLRAGDPDIPLFVQRAVERALAKSPEERFQTASDFAEALTSEMVVARVGKGRWSWRFPAAAVVGVVLVTAWVLSTVIGGPAYERLAVLPPTNLMNDPEQEHLVQGMHEALISELQMAGVPVIARTSVMQYQNRQIPISEIVAELGVDALIESSVFRAGDSLEIEVRLVDGGSQQYVTEPIIRAGELRNVLTLYRDLTRAIASEIHTALTPQAEARLASAQPVNEQAYEAYLKGTQARLALTAGSLETAENYYRLALQIDPNFAAAWAGIARVWNGRGQMGITTANEAMANSKEAVLKALALDEADWDAHRALAGILTWGDWDWSSAETQWNRILKEKPNNSDALAGHSHFLLNMGRTEEGLAQIERALELDPFNVKVQSFYVIGLVYVRRYEDAIAVAREAMRLQPDAPVARSGLYYGLFMKSMFDEFLALDRERFGNDRELLEALERGQAERGFTGAQQRLAEVLAGRFVDPGGPSAYNVALRYLYSGDRDQALLWLERAYQDGDGNMPYLGLPIYVSLRSDPRFQELVRRMGLPS